MRTAKVLLLCAIIFHGDALLVLFFISSSSAFGDHDVAALVVLSALLVNDVQSNFLTVVADWFDLTLKLFLLGAYSGAERIFFLLH